MPKSVLSRRRSFVARFTALAMVASLMVIGAAPASAAIDTSDSCPSTTPSAGFTDIGGLDATTQLAINCLVSYGISNGTSATTYSPNGEVTRWQMALFLTRQVTVHGVSLPSGAPQGFTDIAGLPASYQIAINQLSQLEITQGTSATTFSPHDPVTRWQMALFLTRLLTAAGVSLPSGAPQGFNDLGGLSNEAQLAINQLAQLDIADGTSATTFNPFANVNRWQMALFLTRTLAVDGVTPSQALVSITPSEAVTLGSGQARTFTATFLNPNGTAYVGPVGIRVLDTTAAGAANFSSVDDGFTIVGARTDALVGAAETITGSPGPDGQVTFTIVNNTAEAVVVLAWQNHTGGTAGFDTGEPSATTGVITFSAQAPAAAVSGSYAVTVTSTIKANNTFAGSAGGVNCGNGAGAACTFAYDDNDIFAIGASATTLAGFEAALSASDTATITYQASAAGQSTFTLTNATASVSVTTPAAATSVDAATYTISGSADPGATVRVYNDPSNNGQDAEQGEGVVATTTASADGAYSVTVNLTQNAANNFFVTQIPVGGAESAAVDVSTITDGTATAATITGTVGTDGAGVAGTLDPGDTIAITFSKPLSGVSNGDTVTVNDGPDTAVLTLGPNVGWALSNSNMTLTLTINAVVAGNAINSPTSITAVSGFTGNDGLAINVAGSGGAAKTFTH